MTWPGNGGIWSGLHKESSLIGGPGGSFKTGRVRAQFGRSERFDSVWKAWKQALPRAPETAGANAERALTGYGENKASVVSLLAA